jgi:hypothetical protein
VNREKNSCHSRLNPIIFIIPTFHGVSLHNPGAIPARDHAIWMPEILRIFPGFSPEPAGYLEIVGMPMAWHYIVSNNAGSGIMLICILHIMGVQDRVKKADRFDDLEKR